MNRLKHSIKLTFSTKTLSVKLFLYNYKTFFIGKTAWTDSNLFISNTNVLFHFHPCEISWKINQSLAVEIISPHVGGGVMRGMLGCSVILWRPHLECWSFLPAAAREQQHRANEGRRRTEENTLILSQIKNRTGADVGVLRIAPIMSWRVWSLGVLETQLIVLYSLFKHAVWRATFSRSFLHRRHLK